VNGKNGITEISKNLAKYRSKNNFFGSSKNNYLECPNWIVGMKIFYSIIIMLEHPT